MSTYQRKHMRRPRRRSDEVAAANAMEEVRQQYEDRQIRQAVDAMLRQGYLDDPQSGAYDLPGLVDAEIIELGE